MRISNERKKVIDDLVTDLCRNYDVGNFDELKRAAEDRGIAVIQDNSVIVPHAAYYPTSKKNYIFTRYYLFEDSRKNILAHEMGHAMLDHGYVFPTEPEQRELEAEYFQAQLGYPCPRFSNIQGWVIVVEVIASLVTNPFEFINYAIRDILFADGQMFSDRKLILGDNISSARTSN